MDFLTQNIEYILAGFAVLGALLFLARFVVKLTPNKVDDAVVEVIDAARDALEAKAKQVKADKDKSGAHKPESQ